MLPPTRLPNVLPHPSPLGDPGLAPNHQMIAGLSLTSTRSLDPMDHVTEAGANHGVLEQELVVSAGRSLSFAFQLLPNSLASRGLTSIPFPNVPVHSGEPLLPAADGARRHWIFPPRESDPQRAESNECW